MVDNDAFASFVRRIMKAYAKRIGDGDIGALADLAAVRDAVDDALAAAVANLRAEPHAYSWTQIGRELGITKQAAMKRWPNSGGARRSGGQPSHRR